MTVCLTPKDYLWYHSVLAEMGHPETLDSPTLKRDVADMAAKMKRAAHSRTEAAHVASAREKKQRKNTLHALNKHDGRAVYGDGHVEDAQGDSDDDLGPGLDEGDAGAEATPGAPAGSGLPIARLILLWPLGKEEEWIWMLFVDIETEATWAGCYTDLVIEIACYL